MNGPPGQRGVAAPKGARGRRRVARLPACPPRGPYAAKALAEAACEEPAVPAGRVVGLGPARYARGRRRCLIFLRRETCSAPHPAPRPASRSCQAPPRARPAPPPSADPSAVARSPGRRRPPHASAERG